MVHSLFSSDPEISALSPAFGVPDIAEAEIVLFGPKERDVIERFTSAEDVVRRHLALTLGDDPMLHANSLTGQPVRPARDVAGGEDAWNAGFQVLVDGDAAIDRKACLFRQGD